MGKVSEVDDRFKNFGTVSFTSVTKVNDFVGHLEQGKIMGTRCAGCHLVFFPPRADCYHCLGSDMAWFQITGKGKLLAYSKLAFAPVGFAEDLPYTIAILDYGSHKVFGRISGGVSEEELRTGMEMETVVNRLPGGRLNYVFKRA